MKHEITKVCADALRAFTQDNYGIQLKSSHAHELVAAYFGYASRAAMLADKNFPIRNLSNAEIIVQNPVQNLVEQRVKTLEGLPLGLPSSDVLAEGVYAPIISKENFFGNLWPNFREAAIALSDERAFSNLRLMGMDPKELDWLIDVDVKTTASEVLMTVLIDYPSTAVKPLRHASVAITLPRVAARIGFGQPKILPTFYHGHMTDPDFRLKHDIA
jgi:hypothetical protein